MDHQIISERAGETLQDLKTETAAALEEEILQPRGAFTIAFSREAGTRGTLIAQEVGERLGWPVYDQKLLEHIAQDMGVRTALLEGVDERWQSWLSETVRAFLSAPSTKGEWGPLVTEEGYVHHLIKVVRALGAEGQCVIIGRGSPFILPAETTLRVRLFGSLRHRVAALSRKLSISEREAAQRIRDLDRQRREFVKSYFFKDPGDARNYDLILNDTRFSVAASAGLVIEALRGFQAGVPHRELPRD